MEQWVLWNPKIHYPIHYTTSRSVAAVSCVLKGVDPLKVEIGSAQDLGSSCASFVQHSLSPDSAYGEGNLSKVDIGNTS